MLRVVWIVPGFSSDENDWCIPALLDLARALARRCDLTIVTMRYPFRSGTYVVAGATVHSIGGAHRGPRYTPGIWRKTAGVVRDVRCDVLHAFWAYEPGLIAARFSSRQPVVISLAGGELVHIPEIQYGLMGKARSRIPICWALRRARVVTAGSSLLVDHAQKLLSLPRLVHLPLGVDLRRWPLGRHDCNPPLVLSVGSLQPVKGQTVLLRAFKLVLERFPAARLRIVGDGPQRENLETLSRRLGLFQQVEIAGSIPHQDLPGCYGEASLFVQASWHEAQGMALLEAAACGLPVTGTEVGALADLAPAAALGVPPGDEQQLAAAMLTLLDNSDRAAHLGQEARKKVEKIYDVEITAMRFLDLYHSLL